MRKIKRLKYNITEAIIGMDFEFANKLCLSNGYKLGGNIKFWSISYKLDKENKIIEAKII
jgi:hypothetical protein